MYELSFLPTPLYLTLKSFLSNAVSCEEEISNSRPIKAGVPRGSVLSPTLYNISYTANLQQSTNTVLVTFADDTAITSSNSDINTATNNLPNSTSRAVHFMEDKNKRKQIHPQNFYP